VLFAERADAPAPQPETVREFSGQLPRRDASPAEADVSLTESVEAWPQDEATAERSIYSGRFRAGAKLDPRRLILVERVAGGRLGANPEAPLVRGRTGTLDKKPWRDLEPPQGAVEAEFIRPVYLGESIGPYLPYPPVLGVIPWNEEGREIFSAASAASHGFSRLASWLAACEALWDEHGRKRTTFRAKLDFYRLLSSQFPIRGPRVVYSKSGTNPVAAIIRDERAIIDHKLYWATIENEQEGHYLLGIFNSDTIRERVERWQSQGQWGARDFDKVVFRLPIPAFSEGNALHAEIAGAAHEAEAVAAGLLPNEREHFTRSRRRIRAALSDAGIAQRVDALVARLLDGG
jgi:hypothetical protein